MRGFGKAQTGNVLFDRQIVASFADNQTAQIVALGDLHDSVELGWLVNARRVFRGWIFALRRHGEIQPVEVDLARFADGLDTNGGTLFQWKMFTPAREVRASLKRVVVATDKRAQTRVGGGSRSGLGQRRGDGAFIIGADRACASGPPPPPGSSPPSFAGIGQ